MPSSISYSGNSPNRRSKYIAKIQIFQQMQRLKLSFLTDSHQARLSLLGTIFNMKLLCKKISEKTRNSEAYHKFNPKFLDRHPALSR
ncbi:hypothetical protein N9363_10410, partial [Paracoccaceae bacterium]|nr:hypothetical protein [Paracoccaceae bacterium]